MRFLGQMGTIVPFIVFPVVIGGNLAAPLVSGTEGLWRAEPAIAATPKATTINETQIRQIIDAMQAASNSRNLDGIMQHLAPKVVIEMTIESPVAPQSFRLTKNEYRQYLQQGFGMTQNYSGKYSDLKVQVAPNGKSATATYLMTETIIVQNQISLNSTSNSAMKFELIQGQILITSFQANTRIDLP
jgi:ketosteroid isomerase-like protein